MTRSRIRTASLFDGEALRRGGKWLIEIDNGVIVSVREDAETPADIEAGFVMPGLVEAHAHIFLDGSELDAGRRSAALKADFPTMMQTARDNVAKSARAGVTLVRDAGDRHGVNHAMRAELAERADSPVRLRSPGLGLKRPKRYGGFMARDVESREDIVQAVAEAAADSDDIKIILTGVIDFQNGTVKGEPQFNADELRLIVEQSHRLGRKTFAHCSGLAGLEVAAEAGVDSIEHGFFMTRGILETMAEKGIAWVPTFAPVQFQWERPEIVGWDATAIAHLRAILDAHLAHVAIAHALGVPLVAGSDAGSPGVDHGAALIGELEHFLAAGLPLEAALISATSRPRALWGCPSADIKAGNAAELVVYDRSPFDDILALRRPREAIRGGRRFDVRGG
jgi:imidazolonepropionase-like amidohydrolase